MPGYPVLDAAKVTRPTLGPAEVVLLEVPVADLHPLAAVKVDRVLRAVGDRQVPPRGVGVPARSDVLGNCDTRPGLADNLADVGQQLGVTGLQGLADRQPQRA